MGDEEFKEEEPVNRPEQQVNQIQGSPQVETASSSSKAKKKARQATNDGQSRKCLPVSEKVQVIRASQDEKQSIRQLARRFACGKTQIAKIIADKEKIIDKWMSNGSSTIKRSLLTQESSKLGKRTTGGSYCDMLLAKWMEENCE